ncbi:MAG: flagellar basal-body rod protein FlgF [Maricaulaceae bacterium]|jgi:flagellar basal-body rod protein FlgF
MDNAVLIGLSRQLTLRREMDVTANNLANMSTSGFKFERLLLNDIAADRPAQADDGGPITFVSNWGLARDFTPGQLEPTQRPFDVALRGEGFFQVETENGEILYTRDGRFALNADGELSTADGRPVLDDGGATIVLPAGADGLVIDQSGSITVDGQALGRIGVVDFDNLGALEKTGDGLYRTDEPSLPVDAPQIAQGYVEKSNVNAIAEITRLIDVTRSYESVTRMLSSDEELKRRAIDKLSGVR